ncbi:MAG TPA: hypothetical protein PKV41_04700 [Candidatus Omnitrophota bacterium]|nr:hypothetical protein [Candidatus Omnitrophota bacterium]
MEKRLFVAGIAISFCLHAAGIVVLSFPYVDAFKRSKSPRSSELIYQDLKSPDKKGKEASFEDLKLMKDPQAYDEEPLKILDRKNELFSTLGDRIKDLSKLTGNLRSSQKSSEKVITMDLGKKITLPPLTTEKINNPKYLTYNDDMRDMISRNIKQRAYTYVNHPDFQAGEVYLTFILASEGALKAVKIIEDKTRANDYLRDVALRSIKESNPFPPFPKGFDYPEFTFNLLITFQN